MTVEPARLFVALELPADVKVGVARWAGQRLRGLDGWRAIDAGALHLTLCFLGSRPVGNIETIVAECAALADERSVSVSLGDVMWLPRRRPRVLAIALAAGAPEARRLTGLQARLAGALERAGVYEPERRPFLAHITVARARRGARVSAEAGGLPPPEPVSFLLSTLTLFRSHPQRGGSRYEPLARVPLGGA